MSSHDDIAKRALKNYSESTPWPDNDAWHQRTFESEKKIVEKWLSIITSDDMKILNAGSGGTEYETKGKVIHLDIVEMYIQHLSDYIVGSIENIDLPNESVDGLICVGSVINYTDAQRAIAEFERILKPNGFFIIEFERSNSAEFIGTGKHGKPIFSKEYTYNEQEHLLWLYSEKHIRLILRQYNLFVKQTKRIHCLSSLLYRFGILEEKAAPYAKYDAFFQRFSYPIAHNVLLLGTKAPF